MSIDWRKHPDTVLLEDRPGPLKDSSVVEDHLVSTDEQGFTALIRAMTARIK
jgi:BRCT domain type II-containing protein